MATSLTLRSVKGSALTHSEVDTNFTNLRDTADAAAVADGSNATGTWGIGVTGNAGTATALQTARNIALGGDLSGSASFDGTANITITATVADDSHNHVIANVDGLQTELNAKVDLAGDTMTGKLTLDTPVAGNASATFPHGVAPTTPVNGDFWTTTGGPFMRINGGTQRLFHDAYHPNADTLTTARTITLGGDLSGSQSFDGSANITITATVADDSHNHIIGNVDGLQSALDAKAALASPSLTGTPTAPTAAVNTNTTQIATTAYVIAQIADDAPTKTGTGASGTWGIGITGNAGTATALQTGRTISLTGDVTGTSAAFDGTGNVSITATVADDSHNHIVANIDGLQSTLDGKVDIAGETMTGQLIGKASNTTSAPFRVPHGSAPTSPVNGDLWSTTGGPYMRVNGTSQRMFHDGYHPNADTLTTSRTISLGGDLSGSAGFNGSANITITATVADDSHNHIIANVDGLQTALDGKQASNANLDTYVANPLAATELAELQNIGATTISATQWGYLGNMNQNVRTTDNVSFGTVTASLTGNASTATTLQTSRTINGTNFNGSANITTANWGTSRTLTIGDTGKAVNGSGNVSWSIAEIGALDKDNPVVTGTMREDHYSLTGTAINPANGSVQYKTLSANTTFTESLANGDAVLLMIDDGTAFTITWPTITWLSDGGSAPTLQTTGYTAITIFQMNGTLYGFAANGA